MLICSNCAEEAGRCDGCGKVIDKSNPVYCLDTQEQGHLHYCCLRCFYNAVVGALVFEAEAVEMDTLTPDAGAAEMAEAEMARRKADKETGEFTEKKEDETIETETIDGKGETL